VRSLLLLLLLLLLFLLLVVNTSCSFLPFLLGGLSEDSRYVNENSLLLSIAAAVVAVSLRGVAAEAGMQPGRAMLADIGAGLHRAWMGNGYQWDYFACAAGTNLAVLFSCSCLPWSHSGNAGAGRGAAARRAAGEDDAESLGEGDGASATRVPVDGAHLLAYVDGKRQHDSVEAGDDIRRCEVEPGSLQDEASPCHQGRRRGSSPVFAEGLAAHQANSPGL